MATATPPKPTYPRPPVHWVGLFQEPVYADGQLYVDGTDDEDDEPAIAPIR
jgi:hypothetical protein